MAKRNSRSAPSNGALKNSADGKTAGSQTKGGKAGGPRSADGKAGGEHSETEVLADTTGVVAPASSISSDETPMMAAPLDPEAANAAQTSATGKSVARATAGIVPLHLARFAIGFLAQPLIAHSLGLRWQADAYTVATDIVQRIWLVFEKVVNPSFLPCFIRSLKEEGEESAWQFTSTALILTMICLLVVAPLAWWQMPFIIGIYSQKSAQDPKQMALTIGIARVLLCGLFFLGVSSMTYVILNGYKRFALAALGDTLWKLGVMLAAVAAVVKRLPPAEAVNVLAAGFILGSFLKLLPHLVALRAKWKFFRPRVDLRHPMVRKMMALGMPLLLGILVSEGRGIYLQRLADDPHIQIEASRAALKWSRIIGDNLIQIFPYALSIGIFPYLADLARERNKQPLTDTLIGALRVCFFVFAPLSAILIAVRFPLLRAVWESGRLTQQDTIAMSGPFVGFTIGLIAFACEMMLNQTFYAMTNVWIPTVIGIFTTVLWIGMAQGGIRFGLGLAAIAAAESIAKSIKCIILWVLLRPRLGDVKVRENLVFLLKVVLTAAAAGLAAGALGAMAPTSSHASHFKLKMLLAVTLAGSGGLAAYLWLCYLLHVREMHSILEFSHKALGRLAPILRRLKSTAMGPW